MTTQSRAARSRRPGHRLVRRIGVLSLLGVALVAAGCGGAPDQNASAGTTVVQDGVSYEVQTSRELNPLEPDDRNLLTGMSRRELADTPGAVLVGVFLQASNDGSTPRRAIAAPQLLSAEGQVFRPLALPPVDPFTYRGGRLAPGGQLPTPDSEAAQGPDQGSLVVYRVPAATFMTDRPFVVRFGTTEHAASVQLDL